MSVDFTVAIPTYNGERRLPKVLEKLQSQTGVDNLNWEIIIVDNNSTDGTKHLIENYQNNWYCPCMLRYVFEPEQGLAFARQRAIEEAKGELVGFLDDDNLPAYNWVNAAYEFGQKNPKAGAYGSRIHGLFEVEPSESLKPIIFYLAITERGLQPLLYEPSHKGVPPGAGLVVRRQVWENSVPQRLFLSGRVGSSMLAGEDSEAILHIHQAGWEIWYNPVMEVEHVIPSWRLERNYLISLMRGIGLSRYHLRMLLLKNWQRPLFTLLYLLSDLHKVVLHYMRYRIVIESNVVAACEMQRLFTTLISPFYLYKIRLTRLIKSLLNSDKKEK